MAFSDWAVPSLRIRPEWVREGCIRNGATPRQGKSKLCGLAVLFGADWPTWADATEAQDYLSGFIDGFDSNAEPQDSPETEMAGYLDGLAAWLAVKDLAE